MSCEKLDSKKKQELVDKFRQDPSSNVCVSGGFFSEYRNDRKRVGQCKIVRSLDHPKVNCRANEALCNPTVFCYGIDTKTGGERFHPTYICVRAGQDITKKCKATLDEKLALDALKPKLNSRIQKDNPELYRELMSAKPRRCESQRTGPAFAAGGLG
ncbi:MAG: hypothetical protein HC902_07025 [Calothrix sp. SM1_5_4]|nr:hypothetical protein [Calothrix sp. SM1_5_4]